MIKVGQFMSSRLDVLPPEITNELEGLQDEVPPVPFAADPRPRRGGAGRAARAARSPRSTQVPLAAASLGQAHRARLLPGRRRRHRARRRGGQGAAAGHRRRSSTSTWRRCARWAAGSAACGWSPTASTCRRWSRSSRTTSLEEIDYLHEAANAGALRRGLRRRRPGGGARGRLGAHHPARAHPRGRHGDQDHRRRTALRAAGIDPAEVAPVFAAVMFDQLFTNGFFHADPHPGQHLRHPVPPTGPAPHPWKLTFIDFGMMGEVPTSTRSGLRKLLIAAAARDGKGLVDGDPRRGRAAALGRHRRARAGDDAAVRPVRRHGLRRAARGGPAGVPRLRRGVRRRGALAAVPAAGELPAHHPRDVADLRGVQLARSGVQPLGLGRALRGAAAARASAATWCRTWPSRSWTRRRWPCGCPSAWMRLAVQLEDGSLVGGQPAPGAAVGAPGAHRGRGPHRHWCSVRCSSPEPCCAPMTLVLGNVLMCVSVLPLLHGLWAGRRRR